MSQQRLARVDAYRKLDAINTKLMYLQEEYQTQRQVEIARMERFQREGGRRSGARSQRAIRREQLKAEASMI